jgi:hypothetical protein
VTCEALAGAAVAAGARLLRGVDRIELQLGSAPTVRYLADGAERTVRCRLIVGAREMEMTNWLEKAEAELS